MPGSSFNELPDPHQDFQSQNNTDASGNRSFGKKAKLWQMRNTSMETPAATVSRYAQRLIDRLTGKAFSADELVPSAENIAEGLGYAAAAVDSIAWHSRFKAPATGSDGAALTSVIAIGTVTAWTGTGTLRTGSNGINGQNAISFNGSSNSFTTTTGGLAMQSEFYAACVIKHASITNHQDYISFGDATNYERRSLHKYYPTSYASVITESSGLNTGSGSGTTLANATTYYLEMLYKGSVLKLYVNGVEIDSNSTEGYGLNMSVFTGDAVNIGKNLAGGEFFNGLMAEAFLKSTVPTPAELRAIRGYVATTYGITVAGSSSTYQPVVNVSSSLTMSSTGALGSQNYFVVGAGDPINVGGQATGNSFTTPAALSVHGPFAAFVGGREHMLANFGQSINTVAIWNKCPSGYSAVRLLDYNGYERSALGFGVNQEPWAATTSGSTYLEVSNFADTSKFGIFRTIQTKASGTYAIRYELQEAGDQVWYNNAHHTSRTTQMTLENSTGNLTIGTGQLIVSTQKTPSSASDTGVKGTICSDANYIYVCTATNTWKRTAIATW